MEIDNIKDFLKTPRVLVFLTATFLVMINIAVSYAIVPVYLVERGFSLAEAGLSTTVYSISAIVLRIFFGNLSDKKGKRFVLLLSIAAIIASWILIWSASNFYLHIVARLFQSFGLALYMPTSTAYLSTMADKSILGSALGIYRGIFSLGFMIGPVFGIFLKNIGYETMFTTLILILAMTMLIMISVKDQVIKEHISINSNVLRSYMSLLGVNKLRSFYMLMIVLTCGYGIINTFSVVFIEGRKGLMSPGIFLMLLAFCGMISSFISGRLIERLGTKRVISFAVAAALSGFILMSLVERLGNPILVMVILLSGFGTQLAVVATLTSIGKQVENNHRAASFSLHDCAYDTGVAAGNMFFGIIVAGAGYSRSFLFTGILLILGYLAVIASYNFFHNPEVDNTPEQ